MRVSSLTSIAAIVLMTGALLVTCGPYSSTSDVTARLRQLSIDVRQLSIDVVKKMAEVNESGAGKKTDAELIELAQEAVKGDLKDPGSAQFRNVAVRKIEAGRVVCGQVNAKNSYGGYVGFKEFVGGGGDGIDRVDRVTVSGGRPHRECRDSDGLLLSQAVSA